MSKLEIDNLIAKRKLDKQIGVVATCIEITLLALVICAIAPYLVF